MRHDNTEWKSLDPSGVVTSFIGNISRHSDLEKRGCIIKYDGEWRLRFANRMWLADASGLSAAIFGTVGTLGPRHREKVTRAQMQILKGECDQSWLDWWFEEVEE